MKRFTYLLLIAGLILFTVLIGHHGFSDVVTLEYNKNLGAE